MNPVLGLAFTMFFFVFQERPAAMLPTVVVFAAALGLISGKRHLINYSKSGGSHWDLNS
jgi:hypothetical protein